MTAGRDYVLMHKDIVAAEVCFDADTGAVLNFAVSSQRHIPILEPSMSVRQAFARWWDRRAVPAHQLKTASFLSGRTRMEYLLQNLGLSLNDHYWVRPAEENLRWTEINLYENAFRELDLYEEHMTETIPYKPSATTQGELWKRWVIKNGERWLVKGNPGDNCRQSINEVFAAKLHHMQNRPHVDYVLFEGGARCMSRNFTDVHTEFIPCYDITFLESQPNDQSVYEHYIQTCVHQGLPEEVMRDAMDYLILSDFLLTNTDRHLGNLGILRDSGSLEWKCPAPIFDCGNSMFYGMKYSAKTIHAIQTNSFASTELAMLKYVGNRSALDLNRIPGTELFDELYRHDPYAVVYLDNMKRGYDKKIQMLDAFQRGYSLNPRSRSYYSGVSAETIEIEEDSPTLD